MCLRLPTRVSRTFLWLSRSAGLSGDESGAPHGCYASVWLARLDMAESSQYSWLGWAGQDQKAHSNTAGPEGLREQMPRWSEK